MATTTSPPQRQPVGRRSGSSAKHHAALAVVEGIGIVLFHLPVLIHFAVVGAVHLPTVLRHRLGRRDRSHLPPSPPSAGAHPDLAGRRW